MYFYKFTQSRKGIVTTTEPLTGTMESTTKNIGGVEIQVRQQATSNDVQFGFTAISPELADQMDLQVGDELPLVITDKQVVNNTTGELIPNLFWAH